MGDRNAKVARSSLSTRESFFGGPVSTREQAKAPGWRAIVEDRKRREAEAAERQREEEEARRKAERAGKRGTRPGLGKDAGGWVKAGRGGRGGDEGASGKSAEALRRERLAATRDYSMLLGGGGGKDAAGGSGKAEASRSGDADPFAPPRSPPSRPSSLSRSATALAAAIRRRDGTGGAQAGPSAGRPATPLSARDRRIGSGKAGRAAVAAGAEPVGSKVGRRGAAEAALSRSLQRPATQQSRLLPAAGGLRLARPAVSPVAVRLSPEEERALRAKHARMHQSRIGETLGPRGAAASRGAAAGRPADRGAAAGGSRALSSAGSSSSGALPSSSTRSFYGSRQPPSPAVLRNSLAERRRANDLDEGELSDDFIVSDDDYLDEDDEAGGGGGGGGGGGRTGRAGSSAPDWRQELRATIGYDPSKFRDVDAMDDRGMEVRGYDAIEAEERRSARIGREVDRREAELEAQRIREKEERKKRKRRLALEGD